MIRRNYQAWATARSPKSTPPTSSSFVVVVVAMNIARRERADAHRCITCHVLANPGTSCRRWMRARAKLIWGNRIGPDFPTTPGRHPHSRAVSGQGVLATTDVRRLRSMPQCKIVWETRHRRSAKGYQQPAVADRPKQGHPGAWVVHPIGTGASSALTMPQTAKHALEIRNGRAAGDSGGDTWAKMLPNPAAGRRGRHLITGSYDPVRTSFLWAWRSPSPGCAPFAPEWARQRSYTGSTLALRPRMDVAGMFQQFPGPNRSIWIPVYEGA